MKQRTRLLKPEFFQDEILAQEPAHLRLLFQGLWTIADREGLLEDKHLLIHGFIFPYEPKINVDKLLTRLNELGFIIRYTEQNKSYIYIPNFKEHQSIHHKETQSVIPFPSKVPEKVGQSPALIGKSPTLKGKSPAKKGKSRLTSTSTSTSTFTSTSTSVLDDEKNVDNLKKEKAIDGFNKWLAENPVAVEELVTNLWFWGDQPKSWARDEIRKMRAWIIANPDKGKKKWKRFVGNWLINANEQRKKELYKDPLTSQQEQSYYKSKERTAPRKKEFKNIGEIIERELKDEH